MGPTPGHVTRRALLGLGLVGGMGLIAACSQGGGSPTAVPPTAAPAAATAQPAATPAPASNAQVTLRYGTFWPQYRIDVLNLGIPSFKEANPGVDVGIESAGGQYRDKLTTQMAAGTAPDVMIADYWSNPRYYDQGLMLELTDYLKRDNINVHQDYSLIAVEDWCGKIMAVPFVVSTHAYNYNKKLLKEAGVPDPWDDLKGEWTWDDFRSAMKKTTKVGSDGKNQTWGLSIDYTAHEYHMGNFVYSNGGETADFQNMKYTLDNPKTNEAFHYVYSMLLDDKSILPRSEGQALSNAGIADPFVAGKVAFTDDGTGRQWFWLQNIKDFDWDIAPIPVPQKGMTAIAACAGDCTNVNSKTPYKDQAYSFAKFLGGPVIQGQLAKHKLLLPALKSAASSPDYTAPPPQHMNVLPDNFKRPYRPHFTHFRGLEANGLISKQLELASLKQISLDDALKKANSDANAIVEWKGCHQAQVWK